MGSNRKLSKEKGLNLIQIQAKGYRIEDLYLEVLVISQDKDNKEKNNKFKVVVTIKASVYKPILRLKKLIL